MNSLYELALNEALQNTLTLFVEQYGVSGLERALQLYTNMQQVYICKTKTNISKIKLTDIYYLEIHKHNISIYTPKRTYQKYGSLADEQKHLSPYGFIKCNQSCLVSIHKIQNICKNTITLINEIQLHMSQRYAPKVLAAFARSRVSR